MDATTPERRDSPHCRLNPLLGKWILVSPHRLNRPWHGAQEGTGKEDVTTVDLENNALSPGGLRSNGQITPNYTSTFAFSNDFPALLENMGNVPYVDDPLFQSLPARGTCRVLCFHPDSKVTIPLMTENEIKNVIHLWIDEFKSLAPHNTWVQIFENKGEIMGCSNPHPHGQIWASSYYPSHPQTKCLKQKEFKDCHGTNLLLTYLKRELENKERVVISSEHWLCVVPYWAEWPYETMLLPKRHIIRIDELTGPEIIDLARVIKILTCKYDNLFRCSFPYSMGWLGAPTGDYLGSDQSHWLLHAVYLPPLLRSAIVKKFSVGYEMICQPQTDVTAEAAAAKLRSLPTEHYSLTSHMTA